MPKSIEKPNTHKHKDMKKLFLLGIMLMTFTLSWADDGSRLWLPSQAMNKEAAKVKVTCKQKSAILESAKEELRQGWKWSEKVTLAVEKSAGNEEVYHIILYRDKNGQPLATVKGASDRAVLYGVYELLRLQETGQLKKLSVDKVNGEAVLFDKTFHPAFPLRVLNHWDNLDGSIERGYAGKSIFWSCPSDRKLWKEHIRQYARANASIGINGSVLNNVNASPKMLTADYIDSVRMIADILRPYGIKAYLSINFGTPKALGETETADPLDPAVRNWWKEKVKELYKEVPDFGGFLVKANSEGQPGPFDYDRTHADGANMLSEALRPYGGIVMWRSFVYGARHKGEDRVKQAVSEFHDLDGKFADNVLLQSKNGPLDFQPREPYAPIFDQMKATDQMVEFQITQEYLGQSKHLVYLAPMWKEFFTYIEPGLLRGIAGVSNVGMDANWCGHDFSQANWYAYGRLAWNPDLTAEEIAKEWLTQTYTDDSAFLAEMEDVMMDSREACVDYMMPLGLHHIFKFDHHYGPEPEGFKAEYPLEWCPVYYHKADSLGIGFDRTVATGSGATSQYRAPFASLYDNLETCPEEFLLWFHRVPWNYVMRDGKTLWQNLRTRYQRGVNEVRRFSDTWQRMKPYVDEERWAHTNNLLQTQIRDAEEWRDVCLGYFGSFVPEEQR